MENKDYWKAYINLEYIVSDCCGVLLGVRNFIKSTCPKCKKHMTGISQEEYEKRKIKKFLNG